MPISGDGRRRCSCGHTRTPARGVDPQRALTALGGPLVPDAVNRIDQRASSGAGSASVRQTSQQPTPSLFSQHVCLIQLNCLGPVGAVLKGQFEKERGAGASCSLLGDWLALLLTPVGPMTPQISETLPDRLILLPGLHWHSLLRDRHLALHVKMIDWGARGTRHAATQTSRELRNTWSGHLSSLLPRRLPSMLLRKNCESLLSLALTPAKGRSAPPSRPKRLSFALLACLWILSGIVEKGICLLWLQETLSVVSRHGKTYASVEFSDRWCRS